MADECSRLTTTQITCQGNKRTNIQGFDIGQSDEYLFIAQTVTYVDMRGGHRHQNRP